MRHHQDPAFCPDVVWDFGELLILLDVIEHLLLHVHPLHHGLLDRLCYGHLQGPLDRGLRVPGAVD
eukprot:450986-Pyramimonas_sp.AAC.1